jgi:hypothetical protein
MMLMATEKLAETRTEYAVKGTVGRHGKWQVQIVPSIGHETDREWNEEQVAELREWQASVGLTPDAELVSRTVTVSEWDSAPKSARLSGICRWHYPLGEPDCRECTTATPPAFRKGDLVTYENAPHVVTHVFWGRDCFKVMPGDDPNAHLQYAERHVVSADQLTARPSAQTVPA